MTWVHHPHMEEGGVIIVIWDICRDMIHEVKRVTLVWLQVSLVSPIYLILNL